MLFVVLLLLLIFAGCTTTKYIEEPVAKPQTDLTPVVPLDSHEPEDTRIEPTYPYPPPPPKPKEESKEEPKPFVEEPKSLNSPTQQQILTPQIMPMIIVPIPNTNNYLLIPYNLQQQQGDQRQQQQQQPLN